MAGLGGGLLKVGQQQLVEVDGVGPVGSGTGGGCPGGSCRGGGAPQPAAPRCWPGAPPLKPASSQSSPFSPLLSVLLSPQPPGLNCNTSHGAVQAWKLDFKSVILRV